MTEAFDLEVGSHPTANHHPPPPHILRDCALALAEVNLATGRRANVVSGGLWESGGLYGGDETAERKTKGRGGQR